MILKDSNYEIKIDRYRKVVHIGCRSYRISHIKDSFSKILLEGAETHKHIKHEGPRLVHRDMGISLEDARSLLEVLKDE